MLLGCQRSERELASHPPEAVVGVQAQAQVRQVAELGHPRGLEFGQCAMQIAGARLVSTKHWAMLVYAYRFVDEQ